MTADGRTDGLIGEGTDGLVGDGTVTVDVNGSVRQLAAGTTLAALLRTEAGSTRGSAAVVDGEVVPRSAWDGFELQSGQRIELITAVQGG